jgi:hypothetical protein
MNPGLPKKTFFFIMGEIFGGGKILPLFFWGS